MEWIHRWIGTRRALSLERQRRRLAERRAAALAEIVAAYRDSLEAYQSADQARTAASIAQREALRAEQGHRR